MLIVRVIVLGAVLAVLCVAVWKALDETLFYEIGVQHSTVAMGGRRCAPLLTESLPVF